MTLCLSRLQTVPIKIKGRSCRSVREKRLSNLIEKDYNLGKDVPAASKAAGIIFGIDEGTTISIDFSGS